MVQEELRAAKAIASAGGAGGIRTHDRVSPITVFETVAFNRARPPLQAPVGGGGKMAVPTGFEPAFSALTGPRVWPGYTTGPTAESLASPVASRHPVPVD